METRRITILLIENDPTSTRSLQQMLKKTHTLFPRSRMHGPAGQSIALDVVTAHRIEHGLSHLQQGRIALVLLDLALPGGHTLDALSQVIALAPEVPVIVLATCAMEPLAVQALEHGAVDYLIKEQITPNMIACSICAAIEWYPLDARVQRLTSELHTSEARFRSIIEKNADGIVIVDTDGIVRFVNPAAETLLGFKSVELLGEMFGFPVVAGENIELDVLRRDGSTAVAEMRVVETRWEGATAYVASLRDITEHKRIEEALERLRHQNELILQSAGEGIYGLDMKGNTTFANPAALEMLGYPSEELIGHSLHTRICHSKADGTPYTWEESPIHATFRNQTVYAVDSEVFWRKDGTCFPVEYISTPILERGHLLGAVVIFHDITARKQAEMRRATHFAVTQVIAQSETLFEALPNVLQAICEHVGWELGEMWRIDPDATILRRDSIWNVPTLQIVDLEIASKSINCVPGEGLPGRVWASRQPEWIADVSIDEICMQTATAIDPQLRSACGFPILNGRDVIGVIVFFSQESARPDDNLLAMMGDIGNQIGQFIARRQAEESRWRYAARLEVLSKIDRSILAAQSPAEIANAALGHLRSLVGCQQVSLTLFDKNANEAIVIATDANGSGNSQVSPGERIALDAFKKTPETWQEPHWLGEEAAQLGEYASINEHILSEEISSCICVPLVSRGTLIGALTLGATTHHAFNKENSEIAREVANQLAIAVQQARLFEQVRAGRERLQILSRRLIEAQEAERHRIARELHDEIGQALTAVKISMQAVQRAASASGIETYLDESISIVDRALQQVRNLSLDLRPSLLDDLGLAAALRWYVDRQARLAGFVAEFGVDLGNSRLPPGLETACFRVAQEALTNVVRHARAKRVRVEVRQDDGELRLLIRDDGVGFDVRAAQDRAVHGTSLGILGMQERVLLAGGQIRIESVQARGTEIEAYFPLKSG
jgi:PAS domain S-box-containing protein